MAGSNPRFNATTVRNNLHNAMQMAFPNTVADQPTFRWIVEPTYTGQPAGPSGVPYDMSETPSSYTPIPDLSVLCAVQFGGDAEEGTVAGFEEALKCRITMLDTEYAALIAHGGRLPDQVLLGGATYNMDYVEPPIALFDMDVWTFVCTAQDQP